MKGQPPVRETFHGLAAAKEWARKVEDDLRAGEARAAPRLESEKHTLAKAIDRYLETSNRYPAVLSAVLRQASQEWLWIEKNPCAKVRRMRESRGRVRCLSGDERKRLRTLIRSVRWAEDEWAEVCFEARRRGLRPASYTRAATLRDWPIPLARRGKLPSATRSPLGPMMS